MFVGGLSLSQIQGSDLEPQSTGPKNSQLQWSVTVIELAATDPRPEAFLLLDKWKNGLGSQDAWVSIPFYFLVFIN